MGAGAESHAGGDAKGDTPARGILQPRRHNDQPLTDRDGMVMLFPGFDPVDFFEGLEERRGQGADASQVPQALFDFPAGLLQTGGHWSVPATPQWAYGTPPLTH